MEKLNQIHNLLIKLFYPAGPDLDRPTKLPPFVFRIFSWILLLIFIGFIIYLIYLLFDQRLAKVDLFYTPTSASVTIDGVPYASFGTYKLSPGPHEFVIEKYGFETISTTLDLVSGYNPAHFILQPNLDITQNWYKEHPDDQLIIEGLSSRNSNAKSDELLQKYPALTKLPQIKGRFSLHQASCYGSKTCVLVVSFSPAYHNKAIEYFRENVDSDLGRYYFSFKDYVNPFQGEG